MSLVGFSARNHPQQLAARGRDEAVDDRETTDDVWGPLHARFAFTLDVAAAAHNAKLARFYDWHEDGLAQSWAGERVWCNPPYSDIRPWVEKAWSGGADLVAMLVPANRTEQSWWQDLVEPYRDRAGSPLTTEFLRGRLRFLAPGQSEIGPNEGPPFGCVLLIWNDARPHLHGIQARLSI